jgi:rhomboid protease GluP
MCAEPSTPEISFAIVYDESTGGRYNVDFRGAGVLTVRAEEPRYVFRGAVRKSEANGETAELAIRSDQIWNVVTDGNRVQFATTAGESARKQVWFLFFCRSAQEAEAIASQLPQARLVPPAVEDEFVTKLRALYAGASPWTSITNLIIAVNVVVYIAMGLAGAGWIETESIRPYLLYGANNAALTTQGEWWRAVTCMFLHFGILHLALNMWALYQSGHLVEKLFGRLLFTLVYLGSGIVGSFATLWWHGDEVTSAGASGAVFGVFGGLLGYLLREKHGVPRRVFQPMLKSTLTFAGYNLLFGAIVPHIDNSAHIGGFLGGIVLGWCCAVPLDVEARRRLSLPRLALGTAALAGLVAMGVALAPRYQHQVNIREDLAWSEAMRTSNAAEQQMLARTKTLVARYENDKNAEELTRWIENDALPFYASWLEWVRTFQTTANTDTARQRDLFVRLLQLKVEGLQQLRKDLLAGDSEAFARYAQTQAAIAKTRGESAPEK